MKRLLTNADLLIPIKLFRAMTLNAPLIVIVCLIAFFSLINSQANAQLLRYSYKKKITIDNTKVSGTADLSNFTFLINHTDADLRTIANGGKVTHANGYDIAFTAADGYTLLDHDIEKYVATTGEYIAWVRIPTLDYNDDTEIYIYYGNATVSTDPSATATWDTNFAGVWHLHDDFLDASSNNNDGTNYGSTDVLGKIGQGQDFDGTDDEITIADDASISFGDSGSESPFSISAWVNRDSATERDMIVSKDNNVTDLEFEFWVGNSDRLNFYLEDAENDLLAIKSTAAVVGNNWTHLVATYDGSGLYSGLALYVDGVQLTGGAVVDISTGTWNGISQQNWELDIGEGAYNDNDDYDFRGIIDEVRIANNALSADWIATEYNSQNSPSTFYSLEAEEIHIENYNYYKKITIDHNYVFGTADYIDFPFLISLTDADLKTTANGGDVTHANGYDIVFAAADRTTLLDHDIEKYVASTGEYIAWVRIPVLDYDEDTEIYIYYKNSSISADPSTSGTWNANYKAVWNLSESGSGSMDEFQDATSNYNHAQGGDGAAAATPTQIAGQIGYAQDFDGGDWIAIPKVSNDVNGDAGTLSLWVTANPVSVWMNAFSMETDDTGDNKVIMSWYDAVDGFKMQYTADGNKSAFTTDVVSDDSNWHYMTITWDEAADEVKHFVDGEKVDTDRTLGDWAGTIDIYPAIGASGIAIRENMWDGIIDEVRISSTARSEDWIKTEYYNQYDPDTFYSIEEEPLNNLKGPGGVGSTDGSSGLVLWLDATKITGLNNNDNMITWADQSGYGYDALVGSAPKYSATGGGNNQPSLRFNDEDGSEYMYVEGNADILPTNELSVFVAGNYDLASNDWGVLISTSDDGNWDDGWGIAENGDAENMLFYLDQWDANVCAPPIVDDQNEIWNLIFNTSDNLGYAYKSEWQETGCPYSYNGPLNYDVGGNDDLLIGALGGDGMIGDIEEVIEFNMAVNDAQRIIISNYLSAKYAISLSANDVYDEDDNGDYDFDVAGIGRVDASNIHDEAQGTGVISMLNPTALGNNEFLMWGHDNDILKATDETDVPGSVQARFKRVWRVSEANAAGTSVDVGSVDLRIDLAGLGNVNTSDLRLIVDTDNDGSFADETEIAGASFLTGTVYQFTGVSAIADNYRFTFGSVNVSRTPLGWVYNGAPGAVDDNLMLWLKANAGVLNGVSAATDGQAVDTWVDKSGARTRDAVKIQAPTFRNNATNNINFNPVVEFDGTNDGLDFYDDYIYSTGTGTEDGMTFFAVVKPDLTSGKPNQPIFSFGHTWQNENGFSGLVGDDEIKFFGNTANCYIADDNTPNPYGPDDISTKIVRFTFDFDDQHQSVHLNGEITATDDLANTTTQLTAVEIDESPTHEFLSGPFTIGRQSDNQWIDDVGGKYFQGDIAELIGYKQDVLAADFIKIESYLAIKYGITLDNTGGDIAGDYQASNATLLWDASENSTYHNDIAAIGRDDSTALDQQKSLSVNSDAMVIMDKGAAFDTNYDYIIWGNDNGATTISTTDKDPAYAYRLSREWKVDVNGTPGTVDVRMIYAANNGTASNYAIHVDADGTFASGATSTVASSISGDTITFTAVSLADGNFFTLGFVSSITETRYSVATGAWNATSTWSETSGGPSGASVPMATTAVVIESGYVVTCSTTQNCAKINILAGSVANTELKISAGTLTVEGDMDLSDVGVAKEAKFTLVSGTATINGDLNLNTTDKKTKVEAQGGEITINGDLYLSSTASGLDAEFKLKNAAIGNINGDVIMSAVAVDDAKLKLEDSAILNFTGNIDRTATGNYGELESKEQTIINFNGTSAQTMSMIDYGANTKKWLYSEVRINNPAGVTLDADITQTADNNVLDDIRVQSGTFKSGGFDITLVNGKEFEIAANATYITTTSNAEGGMLLAGNHNISANSTVNFAATGAQNIVRPINLQNAWDYGNVIISGSSTKTISDNDLDIDGDLTISSGDVLNTANNNFELAGDFVNPTASGFVSGTATVTMDGSSLQMITNPDNFYNLTINKSASYIETSGDIQASNSLTMTQGNIDVGSDKITLGTSIANVGTLSYTSGNIIGKFERWIAATASNIDFPLGTASTNQMFSIDFTNLSSGSLITEFIASDPGSLGLPFWANNVRVDNQFTEGYWSVTAANSLATTDYDIELTANAFSSYTIDEQTRIIKRLSSGSSWTLDGDHAAAATPIVYRETLSGISTAEFGLAEVSIVSPGGVSDNLTLWLKADAGVKNSGNPIASGAMDEWENSVENFGFTEIFQKSGAPNLNDNGLNYSPTIYFDGVNDVLNKDNFDADVFFDNTDNTIFYAFHRPTYNISNVVFTGWESDDIVDPDRMAYFQGSTNAGRLRTDIFDQPLTGSTDMVGTNVIARAFSNSSTRRLFINGLKEQENNTPASMTVTANNGDYAIGTIPGGSLTYVAESYTSEIIIYKDALSDADVNKVESYLAIKYGITRDNSLGGTNGDYSNTNESLIWDADNGSAYHNQIIGIGRDDIEALYQKQSHTQDDSTRIYINTLVASNTLNAGTLSSDISYVLIGNNAERNVSVETEFPLEISLAKRIEREWKITNTNFSEDFTLDLTIPGITEEMFDIRLLVDDDGDFTSGTTSAYYNGDGSGISISYSNSILTISGISNAMIASNSTKYISIGVACPTIALSFGAERCGTGTLNLWALVFYGSVNWYADLTGGTSLFTGGSFTTPSISTTTTYYVDVSYGGCTSSPRRAVTATVHEFPVASFSYDGTPYCTDDANPLPSFSGGGIAGTFTSTAGLVFVSSATGQVNLAASTVGDYIVSNTITSPDGCSDVIETTPISITVLGTWTGAISSDWNVTGNWGCGLIPDINQNVIIPNVSNKPILNAGSVGTVQNIVIDNGSSLTITGNTLQIAGTITNNGTFTATAGGVEMKASSAQSIAANTFATNTIKELIISNASGVTLLGSLNITGIVKANGPLASGGYLTLISDATQTALIDGSGTATISGDVCMQRYLASGFGYKYFSSPFQAATVSEFGDDMDLSASFPTFFYYDESMLISGWVDYTAAAGVLSPMHGYSVNFGSSTDALTVDVTDVLNNGLLSRTLYNNDNTYTKGFNLLGNPYPSPIDWNAASGWTKTNIDDALYYFKAAGTDQYSGTYGTYINGVSSDGLATNIIPSMQAFFVHVSDGSFPVTATLAMDNNVRVIDYTHNFLKLADNPSNSMLRLKANYVDQVDLIDPMVVYFDENAESGFESQMDALKLMNTDWLVPNLYAIILDEKKLSINALPLLNDELLIIPFGIKTQRDGEVIFKIEDLIDISLGVQISMNDEVTGIKLNFKDSDENKVYLESGEYNDRFSLHLLKTTTDITDYTHINTMFDAYMYNEKLRIDVKLLPANKGLLIVRNILGQIVLESDINEIGLYEFKLNVNSGIYFVSLMSGNIRNTKKIIIRNK